MVPSPDELEAALINGTYQVFTSDPDATTVNKVRKYVEEQHDLAEGYFISDEWKQRSKALIKEYVDKLLDGWLPESKEKPQAKNGIKREASDEEGSSSPKRQKKSGKSASAGAKPKRKENTPKTKAPKKNTTSRRKSEDVSLDEAADIKKNDAPSVDAEEASEDDALSSIKVDTSQPPLDEEEEYSDVIDEAPKPKRKKKEAKHESPKPTKSAAKKSTAPTSTDDPREAEIKKLQSQLVKCGVRKLWHNELKQFGDDSRAKIRHLKKMLTEIGMDGRFSEAKAREIKETRELLADVDAAKEMNALWGMDSGRRASRSKQKSTKLDESDESDVETAAEKNGGDEDDGDDETTSFAARRRRAQADLAFLGDDSESD